MDKLKNWILSASGWRTTFALSNCEEDDTPKISDDNAYLSALCAYEVATSSQAPKKILIGRDSRPTGSAIAYENIKMLVSLGVQVDYAGICCAPEFFNYSRKGYDAFIYISASHNPIGHNGFKFGKDGGVYDPQITNELIENLRTDCPNTQLRENLEGLMADCNEDLVETVYNFRDYHKEKALQAYKKFTLETAANGQSIVEYKKQLRKAVKEYKIGVVGDINGSARSNSIDKNLLIELGCQTRFDNNIPGKILNPIVPEGENLKYCAKLLSKAHKANPCFSFGFKPDCDGDRGNVVAIDDNGESIIIQAQEIFALMVATELTKSRMQDSKAKLAVVCNGPTSKRVDAIAKALDAKVFRAEVGEANVVMLAKQKRDEGYIVRILGEGSNGGNITYPGQVRDPMQTILSLLTLVCDRTVIDYYCDQMGIDKIDGKVTITKLIKLLPKYTTTGAYSPIAKMQIKNASIKQLKVNYGKEFKKAWKSLKDKYGFSNYHLIKTEGLVESEGIGESTGGTKVEFVDKDDNFIAYIWMRPSGTEPVFRVSCDVLGDNQELCDALIKFHRNLIEKSDKKGKKK